VRWRGISAASCNPATPRVLTGAVAARFLLPASVGAPCSGWRGPALLALYIRRKSESEDGNNIVPPALAKSSRRGREWKRFAYSFLMTFMMFFPARKTCIPISPGSTQASRTRANVAIIKLRSDRRRHHLRHFANSRSPQRHDGRSWLGPARDSAMAFGTAPDNILSAFLIQMECKAPGELFQ